MEVATDFKEFLVNICPSDASLDELRQSHTVLRERMAADGRIATILVSDFLQGSYRRRTIVQPPKGSRLDVDVIAATKLAEREYTPEQAMAVFGPFLDKHYAGQWKAQGRSLGIQLGNVDIDLVVTSAPSESEYGILQSDSVAGDDDIESAKDWTLHKSWISLSKRFARDDALRLLSEAQQGPEWKGEPLRIPDREAGRWESTHPLQQMKWTRDKNSRCSGHFLNVVKAIKWWMQLNADVAPKPKSFPLERIVGECCPDQITSVAEGIVEVLSRVATEYKRFVQARSKPALSDYGVPSHDVLSRLEPSEFAAFHRLVEGTAPRALAAFQSDDRSESCTLWREILGDRFPAPPKGDGGGGRRGYTPPDRPAAPGSGRFALQQ